MLGTYRYVLALLVFHSHIQVTKFHSIWWEGIYAVFGFYVVSGFLMALILNEVYTGKRNIFRYVLNRVLRIYPLYLAAFVLSVLVLYAGMSMEYSKIPDSPKALFSNLTLLYDWDSVNTVTQSWSLRIELVFYLLMIILCRNFTITIIWFFLSVILTIYLLNQELVFSKYYNTLLGSSLAFSGGSLIYFLKSKMSLQVIHLPISFTLWILHLVFAKSIWRFPEIPSAIHAIFHKHHYGLYANVILSILSLIHI